MTLFDITSIIALILSIIAIIFTWGKYRINKKMLELEELKISPHLIIKEVNIYFREIDTKKGISIGKLVLQLENSGGGSANFPKVSWELVLTNGKTYYGEWKSLIVRPDIYSGTFSYIKQDSSVSSEDFISVKLDSLKEIELMDRIFIWIDSKDIRGGEWRSIAVFRFNSKKKEWETEQQSKTFKK